ncbi:glycine-rich protein [Aurantibacillus circumpalustris]|uniref:glycine-rich protein n=1 Tax=Aurantibacillus circumpalustris TaxID=3036359 RepID=UPI00295C1812|nr:glycine-rich protein [Aurantibacillus circumpalustris]
MKHNYISILKLKSFYAVCFALLNFSLIKGQITQTFSYTGGTQIFTVPSCVSTISVEVWGAEGGYGYFGGSVPAGLGGKGGYAAGIITVTQGSVLYLNVGGMGVNGGTGVGGTGGFNGGGLGGSYSTLYGGGGGGGASDIRNGGNALTNRVIVGGGGGGGSSYVVATGGDGGGLTGGNGMQYGGVVSTKSGLGGTQTTGGVAGTDTQAGSAVGTAGALGIGGNSGVAGCSGGGGGGYYGGGGGSGCNGGGGGGGSSYLGGLTNTTTISGVRNGNGLITFTYNFNGAGVIASATSLSICTGSTPTLTASNVLSYTWTPGGSNATSITVSPTSNTSYTVRGTNSLGCISTAIMNVTVDPGIPVLTVANTASASGGICPTKTVILTASGASGYTWTGGLIPVTNGVVFSPTSAVSYTVSGVNACGTTTAVTSVSVHPFPTVNPVTSTSTLCAGGSVTLTATGNATNYAWSGGTGGITNGVGFTPPLTATYTVIGTSALSCTAFATMPVTVYPTPINVPTANPGLICIGGSSTLSATGALSYTWSSTTQTVNTANFIVTPVLGTTTYTITKANSSCVNTQVLSLQTNPLPTVFAIVTPTVVCALTPATLAIGGALTYTWTAPGPPTYTFTGSSPIVSPVVPSIYSVSASDGTCISTTTVFLNANPNPTITATASTPSLCEGQTVNLNASGGINYTWTATGGGIFNGASIADTPTTATAYNVTGDNSFGCTSGASQVVLVYPKPSLTVTSNKALICSGGAATLTALGASTYSWDANANNVLTQAAVVNPIALTSSAVMYTVEGTNSNTGCKNTQTVLVNVFVPTLTINGSTNTCSGGLINLTAGNGVLGTYNWHTGSGTPITNQILQMPLTVASVFTLTANSNSIGLICPATQTIALGIYYNPTITAVPARTLICTKESVGITAAGATSYAWNNTMTGPTITVSPTGTTANYTVTGTDDNGCSSTATVQVKISNCSGLNELSNLNSGVSIYPNPNDGKFTIQSKVDLKLNLVNELGQFIRMIELSAANKHAVNITDLAKGIYFVSGQIDGLQIYQKIVVTK